ncbi:universal stress protein [Yinghuangia aomiensis]|uniref:Universal stress protein n=1 Tax=Yinghuangia aomiensis TaxID=676205 RepID=A0ABP9HB01_9ACTN
MSEINAQGRHLTVAVDGSDHALRAVAWAAAEAEARDSGLRIVHAWLPLPGPEGHATGLAEGRAVLDAAEERAREVAPELEIRSAYAADLVGTMIAEESSDAELFVVGSRGRGGFRSLLLGSTSLAAASVARCPVVVVRPPAEGDKALRPDGSVPPREVVAGIDVRDEADAVLGFAFAAAAAHPGTRVRVLHGWTMGASAIAGGPVFDEVAVEDAVTRALSEAVAGWTEKYPQVPVVRTAVHDAPAAALVDASERAQLTVVGRRSAGTSMGLRLGMVAHAVLLHAYGPVAVVPHDQ